MRCLAVLLNQIGGQRREYNCQGRFSRWRVIKIWWREYVTMDM
jgi:hypothetical protein